MYPIDGKTRTAYMSILSRRIRLTREKRPETGKGTLTKNRGHRDRRRGVKERKEATMQLKRKPNRVPGHQFRSWRVLSWGRRRIRSLEEGSQKPVSKHDEERGRLGNTMGEGVIFDPRGQPEHQKMAEKKRRRDWSTDRKLPGLTHRTA